MDPESIVATEKPEVIEDEGPPLPPALTPRSKKINAVMSQDTVVNQNESSAYAFHEVEATAVSNEVYDAVQVQNFAQSMEGNSPPVEEAKQDEASPQGGQIVLEPNPELYEADLEADDNDGTRAGDPEEVNGDSVQGRNDIRRKRVFLGAVMFMVILVVVIVVAISATAPNDKESETSASVGGPIETPTLEPTHSNKCRRLQAPEDMLETENARDLIGNAEYMTIGCFRAQDSPDKRDVSGLTIDERAQECSISCPTRYFGVDDSTCYCYVDGPTDRFSIATCDPCELETSSVDVFFKVNRDDTCNQETTSKVRNFLVEEDDAPFGFDIVTNEYRPSPFELFKDECGTNIYEVQTEISQGGSTLSTTVSDIKEFAQERRSHLSQSISASASAGYDGSFFSASIKVSGSADSEQNNMFQSSGASTAGSRVFTSIGVQRLAEVKLLDFDNKRNFVTLNQEFSSLLRRYKQSGYDRTVAKEIFSKYGMFVVTRGIFGGYMKLRSTMTESSVARHFSSEEDSRRCYEASIEAKAKGFGFKGSVEIDKEKCRDDAKKEMQESQEAYASEQSEQMVVGGKLIRDNGEVDFIVEPEFAKLLTSSDMYPPGDNGVQLQPLSDFVSPKAISPLEIRRMQIDETGFSEIQTNLQKHTHQELLDFSDLLDGCGDCEVPYLVHSGSQYTCKCYDPDERLTTKPTGHPTVTQYCANGVLAFHEFEGRAYCCSKSCGGCGGSGCTSRPATNAGKECCMGTITDSKNMCANEYVTACIIPVEKTPHLDFDQPYCANGLPNYVASEDRTYCCNGSCESCTHKDDNAFLPCSESTGGPSNCCPHVILGTGVICNDPWDVACYIEGKI